MDTSAAKLVVGLKWPWEGGTTGILTYQSFEKCLVVNFGLGFSQLTLAGVLFFDWRKQLRPRYCITLMICVHKRYILSNSLVALFKGLLFFVAEPPPSRGCFAERATKRRRRQQRCVPALIRWTARVNRKKPSCSPHKLTTSRVNYKKSIPNHIRVNQTPRWLVSQIFLLLPR